MGKNLFLTPSRAMLAAFASEAAELAILLILVDQLEVEGPGFFRLCLLIAAGFAVHRILVPRLRLPWFLALSMLAIPLVLGAETGAWLVALGLGLVGLCCLPLPPAWRLVLLLLAGGGLALARGGVVAIPWPSTVWPILGSMFMFRIASYLLARGELAQPATSTEIMAYFFMLPGPCFPLFPVVDFATYQRSYYDRPPELIHQIGLRWMLRGVAHLIAYRFVYQYATLAPDEVQGALSLTRYVVSGFLLYLRISGQFHLIVGILHLFGWSLPETHHRYLLASSFIDFWRRINIYWKDFITKLVYYPVYFRAKRFGMGTAMILATVAVFAATLLLHSYQWFWLRGNFPLRISDLIFWGILAVLVSANGLYQLRFGRKTRPGRRRPGHDTFARLRLGLQTTATFASICLLWSFWIADSPTGWLDLFTTAHLPGLVAAARTAAPWLVGLGSVVVFGHVADRLPAAVPGTRAELPARPAPGPTLALLRRSLPFLLALLVAQPAVYGVLGATVRSVGDSLHHQRLNRQDGQRLEQGYYEHVLSSSPVPSELVDLERDQEIAGDDENFADSPLRRPTGDFLGSELQPSMRAVIRGGVATTNRWGMRDRDYSREKPAGAYRIALLDASHVFGLGVNDGENFESQLEDRLAREHPQRNIQLLNFAVVAYSPVQKIIHLQRRVWELEPDQVFYFFHPRDTDWTLRYLGTTAVRGLLPPPFLEEVLARHDIGPSMRRGEATRALRNEELAVESWTYQQLLDDCRRHGVVPVAIYLPGPVDTISDKAHLREVARARAAGLPVIDLFDVYSRSGRPAAELTVTPWDIHPNRLGHQLVADYLHDELEQRPDLLGLASEAGEPARRQP